MGGYAELFGGNPGLGQGNLQEEPTDNPAPGFEQNFTQLGDTIQQMAEQAKEAGKPPIKMKVDLSTGTIEGGGVPFELLSSLLDSQRQLQDIRSSFNTEQLRLQQQENALRSGSGKVLNVLNNISAGLAQAPNMPGFVQGLGRANAALNPSPDALAARRGQIMQTLAQLSGQQGQLASAYARENETARHNKATEGQAALNNSRQATADEARATQAQKTAEAQMVYKLSQDARAGALDPMAAQKMMEASGVAPEKAQAMTAYLTEAAQKAQDLRNKAEEAKDAKEKRDFENKLTLQSNRDASQMSRFWAQLEAKEALGQQKNEDQKTRDEKKSSEKLDRLMKPELKDLQNVYETRKALDSIEKIMKENPGAFGPIAGRLGGANPWRSGELEYQYNRVLQALPRTIKVEGAGARGFAPLERTLFERLSESKNKTAEQNLATIKSWRETLEDKESAIRNIARANGYDEEKIDTALGKKSAPAKGNKNSFTDPVTGKTYAW